MKRSNAMCATWGVLAAAGVLLARVAGASPIQGFRPTRK